MQVKVKICGITSKEILEELKAFPVSYAGFVMYPKSPRFIGEYLRELLKVNTSFKKVVVFVNPSYEEAKKALDLGADLIQLHGNETPELGKKLGFERIIKAFRVKDSPPDPGEWKNAYAILLDTYIKGLPGGTGKAFNWEVAKSLITRGLKVFLAGGINPENAVEAAKIKPYALDISSGVEKEPGKKDIQKIRSLFENLKELEPSP